MTRLVICDDEDDVRESTAMVLEMAAYDVASCSRIEELVPLLLKWRPAVLMQDVYMPGLDIDRLIPQLRARPELRGMIILVFTASAEGEEIARRTHADGFIRKPFQADTIHSILDRFMVAHAGGRR